MNLDLSLAENLRFRAISHIWTQTTSLIYSLTLKEVYYTCVYSYNGLTVSCCKNNNFLLVLVTD